MHCKNCGQKNEDDSKYCIKCGQSLGKEVEGSVDRYFKEQKTNQIEEAKKIADQEVRTGVITFIIGLVITIGGYMLAPAGGTYFVLWGAMIYGIYRLIRGFWYKLNPEALLKKTDEKK